METARQITGSLTNRKGRCNATERTHIKNLGSHRRIHRHIKHLETTNLFTSKFRHNYGTENFNDELSGSTVERPLGFAACQSKNHDGVTQQIDDRFAAFETDNTMFLNAATAVHAARQAEDIAFKRFSGKDFARSTMC